MVQLAQLLNKLLNHPGLVQQLEVHGPLIFSTLTFAVVAVLSFGAQVIAFRKQFTFMDFIRHSFPIEGWRSKSLQIDTIMFLVGKLIRNLVYVGDAILAVAIATGFAAILHWAFPHFKPHQAGFAAMIIASILIYVAMDFGLYWTHYLEHKIDFLWEIHKIHHSATFLNPMTAVRTHPLSDKFEHLGVTLTCGVPMGIAMFLFGFNLANTTLLLVNANIIAGLLTFEILHHSQFPIRFGILDKVLVSPRMHQTHHSARYEHWDRNFGIRLSIWDRIFGTHVTAGKDEVLTYGIGRGESYNLRYDNVHGVYIQPIIDSVKVLLGRPVAPLPPPETLEAQGLSEPSHPTKIGRRVKFDPHNERADA
jgi:sterol desaturase/sphingolipid hydroxylase (fatty acid hydroxylase superfamily)